MQFSPAAAVDSLRIRTNCLVLFRDLRCKMYRFSVHTSLPPSRYSLFPLSQGRALTVTSIVDSWLHGSAKPRGLRDGKSQSWNDGGIWALDKASRLEMWASWESGFRRDNAVRLAGLIAACNADSRELAELEMTRDIQRIKQACFSRSLGRLDARGGDGLVGINCPFS